MDKEDIVKYVMHTPANTNPAVLRSMLDAFLAEQGGGDKSNKVGKAVVGKAQVGVN